MKIRWPFKLGLVLATLAGTNYATGTYALQYGVKAGFVAGFSAGESARQFKLATQGEFRKGHVPFNGRKFNKYTEL